MSKKHKEWILITGGSRGIGRGLVEALADEYRVIFTYANNKTIADEIVSEQQEKGKLVNCFQCNGNDPAQVNSLSEQCLSEFGSPYAVINNAGITQDTLMVSMTDDNWRSVVNANLDASFYISRAFLPSMMGERRGVILLMLSLIHISEPTRPR